MSNVAGEVKYVVSVDTKNLKEGLKEASNDVEKSTKENTGKFKGFAGAVGNAAKSAVSFAAKGAALAVGAAAAEMAGLVTSSVKAYSEYEQLYGGIKALFGDDADAISSVMANAQNAYQDLQMSQNEYYQGFSNVYALIAGSIEDSQEAIFQTNRLMSIEADLANTFGYEMDYAANAINWALKGSYNYLDNLNIGITGTKEGFLEAAQGAGFMVNSVEELSSTDIVDVIQFYTEKMGALGKSQEEAATTIQGSLKMTKSAWENLLIAISDPAQDIEDIMANLIESLGGLLGNIIPILQTAVRQTINVIAKLSPEILALIPGILTDLIPAVLEAARALMDAVMAVLPDILQTVLDLAPAILDLALDLIDVLFQNLPMILGMLSKILMQLSIELIKRLPQILQSIVDAILQIATMITQPQNLELILQAGIELLLALAEAIPAIISSLAKALPTIISSIVKFLTDPQNITKLITASVTLFMALVKAVPQILSALFNAFKTLFSDLWARLGNIFTDFAGRFGEGIGRAFKNAINGVLGAIDRTLNAPINAINSAIGLINNIPGVSIGKVPNIKVPRMATGGIVQENANGHLILAGEGGQDEWVVPESKMADMIAKINAGTNQGNNITINVSGIYATSESQKREVALDIWDKINQVNQSRMGAMKLGAI